MYRQQKSAASSHSHSHEAPSTMTTTVAAHYQDPFHTYWKNHPHLTDTPAEQPGGATPPPQLPPSPPKSPPSQDHGVLLQKHHQFQHQQQRQHQPPPSSPFLLRCTCRDPRHGQASLDRIKVCPGEAQGNETICGWCERYHFTLTWEPDDRNNREGSQGANTLDDTQGEERSTYGRRMAYGGGEKLEAERGIATVVKTPHV